MEDSVTNYAHEKRQMQHAGRKDRRLSWISHGKTLSVEFWY